MSVWRQLTHGLRSLVRRRTVERETLDEVQQFLDAAEVDQIARGMSPAEAKRAVRLKYGSALGAQDDLRSFGWEGTVISVLGDMRHGVRLLRRTPGFTIIAVLTLGVGVGSATAIYSAVRPVLFEPLPYPSPERILAVNDRGDDGAPVPVTFGTYRELVDRSRTLHSLAVYKPWQPVTTGRGEPERLDGQSVSADFFDVLGVGPVLGRTFDAADDRPGGPNVLVMGNALWRGRFGSDTTIVGGHVQLNGTEFRVLGVMPSEFEGLVPRTTQVWGLLQYDPSLPSFDGREWGRHLGMVGRVNAELNVAAALTELNRIAANPISEYNRPAWAALREGFVVRSLKDAATGSVKPVLVALLGAVSLLLIISCVNVTNLLLARGARRGGEMAVRHALGAGNLRLARQLLTEGMVLAGLGGIVGLLMAWVGVAALTALSPPELPQLDSITLDAAAFGFAALTTGVIGIVASVIPVVAAARGHLANNLVRASRRVANSHAAVRSFLVAAQVGLASVLLVGAGLLFRSMQSLSDVPTGVDGSNVLAVQVQWSAERFDGPAVQRFYAQALAAVQELPDVASAALTSQLPLSGDLDIYGVQPEDITRADAGAPAFRYTVSPGYFETMRIPLMRGGTLPETPNAGAPSVVVSESLARTVFRGANPLGQRVHVGRPDLPAYTVVGVVPDVKQLALDDDAAEAAYVLAGEWYFADLAMWLAVRSSEPSMSLIPSIKRAVWSVDANQAIVRITPMQDLIVQSESRRRLALLALEAFAMMAVVLSAIGLYGVVAGYVTERWHEIGVRSALGASRHRILSLVVKQGMVLTVAGVVAGLVIAAMTSELVVTLLFGVSRLDPLTYSAVVGLLIVVSAVATWIPAARAASIDPARALRSE